MFSGAVAAQKLGQPQPASNLCSASNSGAPQPMQRYSPFSRWSQYSPENARSVPFSRATWYCVGVSCSRHSASVFSILRLTGLPSIR